MRKLKLKINDRDYTLELNRLSIKWLEANGFSITDFENKPLTYYDLLWTSLFLVNHPDVNLNLAIKLMETYSKNYDVSEIIKFAIEEYTSFMSALTDTKLKKNPNIEIIQK